MLGMVKHGAAATLKPSPRQLKFGLWGLDEATADETLAAVLDTALRDGATL